MATEAARIRLPTGYRPNPTSIIGVIFVALIAVWLVVNLVKTPSEFYNLLLIGVTNGAVYGLIALGYSLVYGILELINFAHGDVFMLGGMLVATMTTAFGLQGESGLVLWGGIIAMLLITMAFCAGINTTIELVAYKRLRNAPRLAPLITAIGMSFILQNVGLVWKGARDEEGEGDRLIDVDPHHRGRVAILGGRPHRLPRPRPLHEPDQSEQHGNRKGDDDEPVPRVGHAAEGEDLAAGKNRVD